MWEQMLVAKINGEQMWLFVRDKPMLWWTYWVQGDWVVHYMSKVDCWNDVVVMLYTYVPQFVKSKYNN